MKLLSLNLSNNNKKKRLLTNSIYIKYFMIKAGNDNPKLKTDLINEIVKKLENILIE